MKAEPERLAEICDNPVNECDLEAWHKWLVTASRKAELAARCKDDPEYYDVLIAGRWCWGLCQWIGGGWCCGEWHGAGSAENRGEGINVRDPARGGKRPHLGGRGVHRQRPHLADAGNGVHRKRPHLSGGQGVHRKRPHLGDAGQHPCSNWFAALAERLRRVRVCCGDWSRVMGPSVTTVHGLTAVFLDPPYSANAGRCESIYKEESLDVACDVYAWCMEHGDDPLLRICLAGYEGEHAMPDDWECVAWKTKGGYGSHGNGNGRANQHRERLWFSPHCLRPAESGGLF
jgi:hypothetical protein